MTSLSQFNVKLLDRFLHKSYNISYRENSMTKEEFIEEYKDFLEEAERQRRAYTPFPPGWRWHVNVLRDFLDAKVGVSLTIQEPWEE